MKVKRIVLEDGGGYIEVINSDNVLEVGELHEWQTGGNVKLKAVVSKIRFETISGAGKITTVYFDSFQFVYFGEAWGNTNE